MTRKTLLKYSPEQLTTRLVRLARMPLSEKTEIEINNTAGIIQDKLYLTK